MEKHEKHYELVQKKWDKLQPRIRRCTCGGIVGLNENLAGTSLRKRFFLECAECHWCGKSRATIHGAIRAWNREMRNHAKWYADHIGDVEEAEEG